MTKKNDRGTAVISIGVTLDEWLQSRANTIGPNTERDYRLAIEHQLKPFKFPAGTLDDQDFVNRTLTGQPNGRLTIARHLGGPARRVDTADFRILGNLRLPRLDDIIISRIRQGFLAEGLSVKRINNVMAPLRGAVARQVKLKHLELNPFDLALPLRKVLPPFARGQMQEVGQTWDTPLPGTETTGFVASEGEPDPFTIDELAAILEKLDSPLGNQVLFCCWTGLRTGELIALRESDLQLEQNRFLVRRSLSRGILKATKTDRQRWVDLLPPARAALEAQLHLLGAPSGWIFPNPITRARWANDSKITKRWRRALEQAGVRYRRPYQMRHTYASMMLSAGENPLYVAQQMGHADWSMLVKVYGSWMPTAAIRPAGSLVAQAHADNWPRLTKACARTPA